MGIKYKTGSGSLPGIPARDLTDDEVKKFGRTFLLKTGLYYEDKPSKKSEPISIKEGEPWQE